MSASDDGVTFTPASPEPVAWVIRRDDQDYTYTTEVEYLVAWRALADAAREPAEQPEPEPSEQGT